MSVVYLGTTEFAAAVLEKLAASAAHRPSLVLTRPDRPRGRGRKLASPPVADAARRLGIELRQPERINDPDARALIGDGRQTVVVCAFGALIKEPLLSEHEMLNVHPSPLPRWRGAAPVERAIMAGDAQTGVSIMRLTAGLDSGPVCMSASEPIDAQDTYGTLAARLQALAGELLVRTLDLKARGTPPPFVEQDDAAATYAEKIDPQDRLLDPQLDAAALERRVRALEPHIGARVRLRDGTLIGVHRAALVSDSGAAAPGDHSPGVLGVTAAGERLLLRCRDGELELLVVQPPGGRAMDAASFMRGHRAATL
ncbi:MAG TPA: methionyl-tRNA formyltransferase [Solirubrobacteraceae bacterium]|nr:methionyl-tRNA formyltransferase [Solirubrobacteraceae bacterium]